VLLDIVHDFCLFVTDIKGSCGPVSGRSEVSSNSFLIGSMNVTNSLIKNDFAFSTHELQH
jgi:hypothetical protein